MCWGGNMDDIYSISADEQLAAITHISLSGSKNHVTMHQFGILQLNHL